LIGAAVGVLIASGVGLGVRAESTDHPTTSDERQ
jgi:hypothetical protein